MATVLAWLLVIGALLLPNKLTAITPWTFLRIPVEALLGIAVLLALPPRPRRVLAVIGGAGLALMTLVKLVDMGFYSVLDRPFDPVFDTTLFDPALVFLSQQVGKAGATAITIGVLLLVIAMIALTAAAVARATRHLAAHQTVATRVTAGLTVVWFACAAFGVAAIPVAPVAAKDTVSLAKAHTVQIRTSLRDQETFSGQVKIDTYRYTPGSQLFTALRGKDVVLTFIESYGRDAVENPWYADGVGAVLEDGNRRLAAAGYDSRSAYLTSPTAGGGSWMAHATLSSGLWVDNQQRYNTFVNSDRLSISSAFARAGWRTVGVMPGVTKAWPEGRVYRFDEIYDADGMGYQGPRFALDTMPDQYTLDAFQRLEYGRSDRGPLMAQMPLTSSHAPWAPLPRMIDWNAIGDGSVFAPMAKEGEKPEEVWRDADKSREHYRRSIEYSLTALISYVERHGDDNLVLIFLGDHQPPPRLTAENATRDVPITIVTRDRAVLDRIASWRWQPGLKPGKDAPVWRMDTFRDRLIAAYSPR